MPRWLQAMRTRLPRATAIWAGLCLLLGLGLLTTLVDLTAVPEAELRQANRTAQRVIIDAVTGDVAGDQSAESVPEAPFEVSTDEEGSEEPAADTPPAEAGPAEAPREAAPGFEGPALRTAAEPAALPAIAAGRESIVAPPAPEITEGSKLKLPKRGAKDATASTLYAKRFQRQEGVAYITLLLTDAGFNAATLNQIVKLPREVTVAFSPYALDPRPQIALLHKAGYETWGMLPAQGTHYPQDDPGPLGIIAGDDAATQLQRLKQTMAATLGAVGLVLPPDEDMAGRKEFAALLKEIDTRGLFLLSTRPGRGMGELTQDPALEAVIRRADVILDSTNSAAFIQSKLAGLKALAEQQGKLIVVASARPQTLALLIEWLDKKPLGAVQLAPLSAMYGPDAPPPPPEAPEGGGHGGGHGGGDAKKESSGGHGGGH